MSTPLARQREQNFSCRCEPTTRKERSQPSSEPRRRTAQQPVRTGAREGLAASASVGGAAGGGSCRSVAGEVEPRMVGDVLRDASTTAAQGSQGAQPRPSVLSSSRLSSSSSSAPSAEEAGLTAVDEPGIEPPMFTRLHSTIAADVFCTDVSVRRAASSGVTPPALRRASLLAALLRARLRRARAASCDAADSVDSSITSAPMPPASRIASWLAAFSCARLRRASAVWTAAPERGFSRRRATRGPMAPAARIMSW
mmetsp:Transcript_42447/g.112442  ORF Transcript_42447/g.112442 Transcript_42447/m.112442 type:complete len:255 (+) Transcript_42447:311-1075(+)